MYYIMSLERDDWGNLAHFRRGPMYKKVQSAINAARKYPNADVLKYGKKIPVFSTNPKMMGLLEKINDQGIN